MRAIFFFKALVFLDNGVPAQVTVRSFDGTPPNPPDGHLPILPISFIFHCLAKGSRVLMGDGSEKLIEDIVTGEHIMSDLDDEPSEVLWTTKGFHYGLAYEFKTETGEKITMSSDHVVVTVAGMKLAHELSPGDEVFRLASPDSRKLEVTKITKVSAIDGYDAEMFNISIQEREVRQSIAGAMYSNGLCVGDATATQTVEFSRKEDITYLKSVVPTMYHKDIDSYFEDFYKKKGEVLK